jgi:hypothetical protein
MSTERTSTCGQPDGVIFSGVSAMVNEPRQLPAPSATAWLIDLAEVGGPSYVVLCREEAVAQQILIRHLVAIGKVTNTMEAEPIVADTPIESVAVIW